MEKETKLKVLKIKFERLKNTCVYFNDDYKKDMLDFNKLPSITKNIIAPALSIDIDEGAAMWQYLLDYYYKLLPGDKMLERITGEVVEEAEYADLVKVFLKYDRICDYAFLISDSKYLLYEKWFIRDTVFNDDFALSDKLIPLILHNDNGEYNAQNKFFDLLMDMIDTSGWTMKSNHIDYVAKWIPFLIDPIKRDEV